MPPFERIASKSCCLAVKSSWRFFFHEIELNESRPKTTSFSRIKQWIFPIPRLVTKLFTRNSLFTALEEWFYETCGVHFPVCKLLSTNISRHLISTKIREGVLLSSVHKTQQGTQLTPGQVLRMLERYLTDSDILLLLWCLPPPIPLIGSLHFKHFTIANFYEQDMKRDDRMVVNLFYVNRDQRQLTQLNKKKVENTLNCC